MCVGAFPKMVILVAARVVSDMNFLGMIICFTGRFDGFVKKPAEASTEALVPWQEVAVASVRSRRKSIIP